MGEGRATVDSSKTGDRLQGTECRHSRLKGHLLSGQPGYLPFYLSLFYGSEKTLTVNRSKHAQESKPRGRNPFRSDHKDRQASSTPFDVHRSGGEQTCQFFGSAPVPSEADTLEFLPGPLSPGRPSLVAVRWPCAPPPGFPSAAQYSSCCPWSSLCSPGGFC